MDISSLLSRIREHIRYACLFYNESARANKFYNEIHLSANAYKRYINDAFKPIIEKILDNPESAYIYKEQFLSSISKLQTLSETLSKDTIHTLEKSVNSRDAKDHEILYVRLFVVSVGYRTPAEVPYKYATVYVFTM